MYRFLVALDRDGTITEDNDFYLGAQQHWRDLITFRPGVIAGLRQLSAHLSIDLVVASNQAGVALTGKDDARGLDFDLLTEERMHEVQDEITRRLAAEGVQFDAVELCPYVDRAYVEKVTRTRGWSVDSAYIQDPCRRLKPNIGMLEDAAKKCGHDLIDYLSVVVIGDRLSDVRTAVEAHGVGVLVASNKTGHDADAVQALAAINEDVYIEETLATAAERILRLQKNMQF